MQLKFNGANRRFVAQYSFTIYYLIILINQNGRYKLCSPSLAHKSRTKGFTVIAFIKNIYIFKNSNKSDQYNKTNPKISNQYNKIQNKKCIQHFMICKAPYIIVMFITYDTRILYFRVLEIITFIFYFKMPIYIYVKVLIHIQIQLNTSLNFRYKALKTYSLEFKGIYWKGNLI